MKVTVLGDGGWGTAISILLLRNGHRVCMWGPDEAYLRKIARTGRNDRFLKGVKIPAGLDVEADINRAVAAGKIIICAIPSQYLKTSLRRIDRSLVRDKIFLCATKGFEHNLLKRPSEIIREIFDVSGISVLSGPTIALEVARGMPSAAVIASRSRSKAKLLQKVISGKTFRVYHSHDIAGVELGGALKNIIAIAAGIADGLGFGTNAKAAIITRGAHEMIRLAKAMGGHQKTLTGLSGFGDLVTTCISLDGRNRQLGYEIGRGKNFKTFLKKSAMVYEGVLTTKSAYQLARKYKVDMPITEQIYRVLYQHKSPRKAVVELMGRSLKSESFGM